MITRRRRIALALISWLYKVTFWLDVHTAPKYDPAKWSALDTITNDEWELSLEEWERLLKEQKYNA